MCFLPAASLAVGQSEVVPSSVRSSSESNFETGVNIGSENVMAFIGYNINTIDSPRSNWFRRGFDRNVVTDLLTSSNNHVLQEKLVETGCNCKENEHKELVSQLINN